MSKRKYYEVTFTIPTVPKVMNTDRVFTSIVCELEDTWDSIRIEDDLYDVNFYMEVDEEPGVGNVMGSIYPVELNEETGCYTTNTETNPFVPVQIHTIKEVEELDFEGFLNLCDDIEKSIKTYKDTYEAYDPEGQLAVHIEFENALREGLTYLKHYRELVEENKRLRR